MFHALYGHANPLMRSVQRLSRGLVVKLASAGHHASDSAGEEDLAALPARRLITDSGEPVAAVLRDAWLSSLHAASSAAAPSGHPRSEP